MFEDTEDVLHLQCPVSCSFLSQRFISHDLKDALLFTDAIAAGEKGMVNGFPHL